MNKERLIFGLLIVFVIVLYVVGNVSHVVAEEGSDRDRDREDRDDDRDDSDDDTDLRDDDRDDSDDDSGRDVFRTRERVRIVGDDGVEREIEIRERLREDGRTEHRIKIKIKESSDEVEIEVEDEIEVEEGSDDNGPILRARLSNGLNADVKVMPDVAAARALEALRLHVCSEENNCSIVLKDVGEREAGDDSVEARVRYELRAEKRYRLFGLFERRAEIRAEIRSDNGDVEIDRPWWAAFSSEVDESGDLINEPQ